MDRENKSSKRKEEKKWKRQDNKKYKNKKIEIGPFWLWDGPHAVYGVFYFLPKKIKW